MNALKFSFVLCVMMVLGRTATGASPNVDDLVKQLQGEAPLAAKSAAELEAAYTAVLPKLTEKPEGDDIALQKIAFRASRPGAENEREALCKALVARLTPDASIPLKVMLMRHLQRIGRGEAVPTLCAMLADKDAQVRECARRALQANPAKSAGDCLRRAMEQSSDGKWIGALISALEYRHDPADSALFARALSMDDDAVKVPAAIAIARSADASAAPLLAAARTKGSEAGKKAATDAYLLLADRLAKSGQKDPAAKIYREFITGPNPYRYAAIIGLGNLGENLPAMVDLLCDKDNQARGAALEVLAAHRDAKLAPAIADKLKGADAQTKPWLLRGLLALDGKKYLSTFVAAASDPDEGVRIQALKCLAVVGDASVAGLLIKSAQAKGDEQVAARNALEVISSADLDKALQPMIAQGETPARVEAIRAIGARNVKEAVPALFKATTDSEAPVRSEAHKSLGLVADQTIVPQLISAVSSAKEDADREQMGRTLAAVLRKSDDDKRLDPVLAAAEKSDGNVKAAYYSVLGQVGGDKALSALRAAAKSSDDKTRESAVRALSNWNDPAPAGDLLKIAKEEKKDNVSILALRGYIRMVGMQSKKPAGELIKMYNEALPAARRPDEKRQVLGGLGGVKDIKAIEAIAPFLSEVAVQNEAISATLKVAKDQWEKNPKLAQKQVKQVNDLLATSKNEGQKKEAAELLAKINAKLGAAASEKKPEPKKAADAKK